MKSSKSSWVKWLNNKLNPVDSAGIVSFISSYQRIADTVLKHANIQPDDIILDIGTGTGLLAFSSLNYISEKGQVIGCDIDKECILDCRRKKNTIKDDRLKFMEGDIFKLPVPDSSTDAVVMRSVLSHIVDKRKAIQSICKVLKPEGRFSLYEPIDRYNTRFYEMIDISKMGKYKQQVIDAEEEIYHNKTDSLMNFDEKDLNQMFQKEGFKNIKYQLVNRETKYKMTKSDAEKWWHIDIGGDYVPGRASPYKLFQNYLDKKIVNHYVKEFVKQLHGKVIIFKSVQIYMWGEK